jgi:polysaccharide chain length determinant protein (PEP-CTERM system associated)
MINPEKIYTLKDYMEIARRRIWYIVVPFLLVMLGISVYAIFAPREYKASTLVLVSPQRVPESYVQATVTSTIEERLQSIAQEVMSRTRLELIIKEMRLYEKERKALAPEEVIELMQKHIKLELPSKREDKGYFTISFIGDNPQVVTAVANRLASLFIEENLKVREEQAVGTTEFLSTELSAVKENLDAQESKITGYKRHFMGELPEQSENNIKILEQLQNQSQRVTESLRAAMDRKLYLQKLMSDMESPSAAPASVLYGKNSHIVEDQNNAAPGISDMTGSYETNKELLTKQLDDLKTKYTDNHPDVIAAKRRLTDLEKNKKIYKETYNVAKDPKYRELKNQMTLTGMEIGRLNAENGDLSRRINAYRARIERTPLREQDMVSMLSEYKSTKESYDRLLKKSQDAQQAENLEKRQKGEQFRIIDPARVPEKPFSPDIPRLLLIGLAAAIGAGFVTAFFKEQSDLTFHDASDLEATLGIKVLASIPKIQKHERSGINVREILRAERKAV